MGHPQTIWINKKRYGSRKYSGHYRWVDGERQFVLISEKPVRGKPHVYTAESAELAEAWGFRILNPRNRKKAKQKKVRGKK